MKILIDNGHGYNTPRKCSPDGSLREYKYTREIASRLVEKLRAANYDADLLTPETYDVSLTTRTRRANSVARLAGSKNVIVISIHNNAAGSKGQWMKARGWSVHVSLNASKSSKQLASCLAKAAAANGQTVRRPLPTQDYWPQNLAICRDTICPAVLTENLFQDNREDTQYLLSEAGKEAIVKLHFDGITNYIKGV